MNAKTHGPRAGMTAENFNARGAGHLPGLIGLSIESVGAEGVRSRLPVRKELMAPNGFLHAASVVALADTSCGYGEGSEGRRIALFRCTQLVLWPQKKASP